MTSLAALAQKHSAPFVVQAMEWRPCVGFGQYEVSEYGDVRHIEAARTRAKGYRLRGSIDADGYLRYSLRDVEGGTHNIAAHRLVALAFIGPPPSELHEVAHNTGSRVASHYRQLRWALRQQNHSDIQEHGTSVKGSGNGNSKVTEADVLDIRREYRAIKFDRGGRSVSDLVERYGVSHATIVKIAQGKSWQHVPMPEVT